MTDFETTKAWWADYNTSSDAAQVGRELFNRLGFSAHYQLARLAIGRSLGEPDYPSAAPDARGNPMIKGNLLFGDEKVGGLLWLALLVESLQRHFPKRAITLDVLQSAVRDHWRRGISLLQQEWDDAGGDYGRFVDLLITRRAALPEDVAGPGELKERPPTPLMVPKAVWLELGKHVDMGEPARWLLNGRGYSPNVAIMGQAGSGKTQMMLKLLSQLRSQTGALVLLIDAGKDELADRPDLARELGATVLKVPRQPIPLDMFHGSTESSETARDVTVAFRESLDKALRDGLTDNQKMRVLEGLKPMFGRREQVTLPDIKQAMDRYYEENNVRQDRVVTILNELCQYTLFTPEMGPAEFFGRSWILAFGGAPEESRRLAVFLLFDALHRYLQTLPEAPMDSDGHRAIGMAVAVDEARPLLAAKHDGLSKMVRLHRSHGLTVFMASQSPDDYEGQSDDYMEQIGLPICFRTNATSTAVLNNMFRSKPNFASLEPGTCLTVLEGQSTRVKAW
ncbi:MAG: hypothetical protein AB1591_01980 [Pseudomonadota bacterium]